MTLPPPYLDFLSINNNEIYLMDIKSINCYIGMKDSEHLAYYCYIRRLNIFSEIKGIKNMSDTLFT